MGDFYSRFLTLCDLNKVKPAMVVEELGLANGLASKWKSGSLPTLRHLLFIADYFDVSIDYLIDRKQVATGDINYVISMLKSLQDRVNTQTADSLSTVEMLSEYSSNMGYPLRSFLRACVVMNYLKEGGLNCLNRQLLRFMPKYHALSHIELYNYLYCICETVNNILIDNNMVNFADTLVVRYSNIWGIFIDDIIFDIRANEDLYKEIKFDSLTNISDIEQYVKKYDYFHGTTVYNYMKILNCADRHTVDINKLKSELKAIMQTSNENGV